MGTTFWNAVNEGIHMARSHPEMQLTHSITFRARSELADCPGRSPDSSTENPCQKLEGE
jgi:hypothetical protein